MDDNVIRKNEIIKKLQRISSMIEEQKLLDEENDPSLSMIFAFQELSEQMEKCKEFCQQLSVDKGIVIDAIKARIYAQKAKDLEKALDSVLQISLTKIQFILQTEQRHVINSSLPKIEHGIERLPIVVNKVPGIIPITSEKRSGEVKNLQAYNLREKNHIKLTWEYDSNTAGVVYLMHVSDVEKDVLFEECDSCVVALGDPQLIPGKRYTFKVRSKVEGMLLGPWSNSATVYYSTAVPSKPRMPHVVVLGTKEIEVIVSLPSEEECNGDPVTHCIVKLLLLKDDNSDWTSYPYLLVDTEDGKLKIVLNDLEEYCTYKICVLYHNNESMYMYK